MKEYPVNYAEGVMSVEDDFPKGAYNCSIGVQMANDGRVWVCINGNNPNRQEKGLPLCKGASNCPCDLKVKVQKT